MAAVVGSQVHLGADTQRRMTRLAALRIERTRLESAFHMRPDRATAMRLAAIYGQLSVELIGIFSPDEMTGSAEAELCQPDASEVIS